MTKPDTDDVLLMPTEESFLLPEDNGPPLGTWASVARMMYDLDPNFDWDAWKDEMKEADLG